LPTTTYSAHYIVDPALRRAVADFLKHERTFVAEEIEEFAEARRSARNDSRRARRGPRRWRLT